MDAYQLASSYARHTNKCVFLTGKAGTGKTTFLRNLSISAEKQMAIVAPTGVAAINAGGATIHSFFQLPPQLFLPTTEERNKLFAEMQMRRQKIQVLRNLELLVIDEISMVRADLLDAIDAVLRHYRHRNLPFGGVQMLFIGDLFQLSPVARYDEWNLLRPYYEGPYFFQARVFKEVAPVYIELDHVFRQQNQQFVDVLNEVRNNCLTPASRALLNSRYQPDYKPSADDYHIILSTHNAKVDGINAEEMAKLPGKVMTYKAEVSGTFPDSMFPIEKTLSLKEGARVMFVKNDTSAEKLFFNGKLGVVKSLAYDHVVVESDGDDILVEATCWENLRYEPGATAETVNVEVVGSFKQIPLRPAWAITIHKSQGLTFDNVVIDAADAFAAGQVYVALSRCRSLEGIVLLSKIPESALTNAQEVLRYTQRQPALDIVNAQLPNSETEYLTALLTGLFDFRDAIRKMDSLRKMTTKEAVYSPETAEFLVTIKGALEGLQVIGETFQNQLRALIYKEMQAKPEQGDVTTQERLKAAAGYFNPKLQELIDRLKASPCTTDNKESRVDFEELINELYVDLLRQSALIAAMAKKAGIKNYQTARSLFRLPTYHISASVEKTKDLSSLPNSQLLFALLNRRKELARDSGSELYTIARTESLKEIAKKLPTTKRELMKIKGFGKTKYDIWGEEIMMMVAQYIMKNSELSSQYRLLPNSLKGKYIK